MPLILLLPVILSLLMMGAHGMRLSQPILMAIPLAMLVLLPWPRKWVARTVQVTLILGALEWLRAMFSYILLRIHLDQPWLRLVFILGGVALFTSLSSLVFRSKSLAQRYQLD
jgi:hypothetical protein